MSTGRRWCWWGGRENGGGRGGGEGVLHVDLRNSCPVSLAVVPVVGNSVITLMTVMRGGREKERE